VKIVSTDFLKQSLIPDISLLRRALLLQGLNGSHSVSKLIFDGRQMLHSSVKFSCHFISGA
jgi:hypothetical protein